MRKLATAILFTLLLTQVGYGQDLSAGLVAHWTFDETAGTTLFDQSGNGHHGTIGSTTVLGQPGVVGNAYQFDGFLSSVVRVPTHADFRFQGDYAVAGWFNLFGFVNDGEGDVLIGQESQNEWTVGIDQSNFDLASFYEFGFDVDAILRFPLSPSILGEWHHFVAQYNSGTHEIFFDGQLAINQNQPTPQINSTSPIGIGGEANAQLRAFWGLLDAFYVYNRALTEDEIQALFSEGVNQPPTAVAGPDQTVECANSDGTSVTLDGTGSSDPDGDPLTYTWTGPFGTATGPTPTVALALGTHTITLTVDDGNGGADTDEVAITVEDTTSPEIIVLADPIELWPPNHKYHTIALSEIVTSAADVCDANVSVGDVVITSTSSDEPENGQGDGNTTDDIVIAGDCASVDLRAERQGGGNGRVYAIHLAVPDASGNEGAASYQVHVPKSKKSGAVDDGPFYTVTGCGTAPLASVAEAGTTQTVKGKLLKGQSAEIPAAYELAQNYPNPFNPSTEIRFDLPEASPVTLVVYDVMGREVARLVEGALAAGIHRVTFDASGLPSGVYLYRITAGSFTRTNRMVLTK